MSDTPVTKSDLRRDLRARRRAIAPIDRIAASHAAAEVFLSAGLLTAGAVVGGYYPLADEISPLPLLAQLSAKGHTVALPVTAARGEALSFRLWQDGERLNTSSFGVKEPATGERVVPDALIVPLLGFDAVGHRLGYGAGHYDCTISALRDGGKTLRVIGFAFDTQYCVRPLPSEPHDIALDCIVTQERLYWPATLKNGEK